MLQNVKRKPMYFFFVFRFELLKVIPYECPGLCLAQKVERKPLISEERLYMPMF